MFAIRAIYLDTNGTRITTDATLNARTMQLIVRENREATEQTKHMGGTGEIPRFVKALVRSDWLEEDYNLQIQEKPLGITRDNCQIIQDVINRKSIYSIPVVYITKDTEYDLPVSQYDIASLLQGSAHVLFESDPLVTERLKKATNDSNPYGGFIGIYFPAKTAKPKRVDPYRSETEADFKRYLVKTINEYHLRQEVKESETFDGIKNTYLDIKNQYLKEKHDEIVVENTDLYNEYGIKLEKYEDLIAQQANRIAALEQENQGLRSKLQCSSHKPVLFAGKEEPLAEDEIKVVILDALHNGLKGLQKGSRRYDIITDILEANQYNDNVDQRKREIKQILKDYTSMTPAIKKELEQFGIEVEEGSKHYKLYWHGDPRYIVTIAATGSDYRIGANNSSEIIQKML